MDALVQQNKRNCLQAMDGYTTIYKDRYGHADLGKHEDLKMGKQTFKDLCVSSAEAQLLAAFKVLTSKNVKTVKQMCTKQQSQVLNSGGSSNDLQPGIAKEAARIQKL